MTSGPRREHDVNNIESVRNVGPVQQPEPFFGSADNSLLLGEVNGFMRRAKQVCTPAFYFNENENIGAIVAAYYIDFATPPRLEVTI